MVLNAHRNHKAYHGRGEREEGLWRWGRGRLYTYRYTVTTRITSALRWAAMRAILMFSNCEGQSHKTVSTNHNFWRERRAGADSNRGPSVCQPNALPLGQTGLLPLRQLHSLFKQWNLSRHQDYCDSVSVSVSTCIVQFNSMLTRCAWCRWWWWREEGMRVENCVNLDVFSAL